MLYRAIDSCARKMKRSLHDQNRQARHRSDGCPLHRLLAKKSWVTLFQGDRCAQARESFGIVEVLTSGGAGKF